MRGVLYPQDFGAVGDGVTDDTVAVTLWREALEVQKKLGLLEGRYRLTAPQLWVLPSGGLAIRGRQRLLDGFILDPGLGMSWTAGLSNGVFDADFSDFRVIADTPGVALRIGKDDFSDGLNSCRFRIFVNNRHQAHGQQVGLRINIVRSDKPRAPAFQLLVITRRHPSVQIGAAPDTHGAFQHPQPSVVAKVEPLLPRGIALESRAHGARSLVSHRLGATSHPLYSQVLKHNIPGISP